MTAIQPPHLPRLKLTSFALTPLDRHRARLAPLVEKLHMQSLTAVMTLDARYAHALGQNPWVARIVVSRIDKQGG